MAAFYFFTKLDQTLLLGRGAQRVTEPLTVIQTIPGSSIYFHTHRLFHQDHRLRPEPPHHVADYVLRSLSLFNQSDVVYL